MDSESHGWDEDGGSYSDSSEPDLDGLNLTEKDDVLVIGIDFGTTYVPNAPLAYMTDHICSSGFPESHMQRRVSSSQRTLV